MPNANPSAISIPKQARELPARYLGRRHRQRIAEDHDIKILLVPLRQIGDRRRDARKPGVKICQNHLRVNDGSHSGAYLSSTKTDVPCNLPQREMTS